jgi:hypothetical protein
MGSRHLFGIYIGFSLVLHLQCSVDKSNTGNDLNACLANSFQKSYRTDIGNGFFPLYRLLLPSGHRNFKMPSLQNSYHHMEIRNGILLCGLPIDVMPSFQKSYCTDNRNDFFFLFLTDCCYHVATGNYIMPSLQNSYHHMEIGNGILLCGLPIDLMPSFQKSYCTENRNDFFSFPYRLLLPCGHRKLYNALLAEQLLPHGNRKWCFTMWTSEMM